MISILIPVYNTSIVELVAALHRQALELAYPFEIICLDDRSRPEYRRMNAPIGELSHVNYLELKQNIGRSRIRNRLTDLATQPYLLFMDGDSRVIKKDYLKVYLQKADPESVIYGGRVYQADPPAETTYQLHWHYGRQREALSAAKRRQHPYRTFMTNNFLVPRAIAGSVRFDESLTRYGYEDTLYALELRKQGYPVRHIDNPLEHIGLEERAVFLQKVEDALENLKVLLPQHPEIDTRLLQLVRQLDHKVLLPLLRGSTPLWLPPLKKIMLTFPRAPLKLLDLYKLGYFLR
jgi:glycosyltransferase involved in cell wall biosynthesis